MLIIFLFCWIAQRLQPFNFGTVFTASVITGLIVFFNAHYTHFIWYETFDMWAHFLDAIVCWGLAGLWLGWYLTRNTATRRTVTVREPADMMSN